MQTKNYLLIGIGSIIILTAAAGLNNHNTTNPNATLVAISLDNSEFYRTYQAHEPTKELFSPAGVTINFSSPSAPTPTIECKLSCQQLEEDTK